MHTLPPAVDPDLLREMPGRLFLVFSAQWCGACPGFKNIVEEISKTESRADFRIVDADQNPELANHCSVTSLPALALLDRGECMATHRGATTRRQLENWIDSLLS